MGVRQRNGSFPWISETLSSRAFLAGAADSYRRELTSVWIAKFGNRVLHGPFKGLQLEQLSAWGDGDVLAKLLGTYEAELHSTIAQSIALNHTLVINVGCAEGFYAIGFARALSAAHVIAFDSDPHARDICSHLAKVNGVDNRLTICGKCTHRDLQELLSRHLSAFIVVDCEGGERDLLSLDEVPQLRTADILVECHDFVHDGTSDLLYDRFSSTHTILAIDENSRDLDAFPALQVLSSLDRAIATCEWRPTRMKWLYCRATHLMS